PGSPVLVRRGGAGRGRGLRPRLAALPPVARYRYFSSRARRVALLGNAVAHRRDDEPITTRRTLAAIRQSRGCKLPSSAGRNRSVETSVNASDSASNLPMPAVPG